MSTSPAEKLDLKYDAVRIAWGRENCESVQFPDDVAGSLSAQYWVVNVIASDYETITAHYFWLNNGSSVDPMVPGATGHAIAYTDGDAGSVIAAAAQVQIDAVADLKGAVSGDTVTYENAFIGKVEEGDKSNASLLTFVQLQESIGGDLGATLEGIELAPAVTTGNLISNQTGNYILGQVLQGAEVSLTASLAELTQERWETVVGGVVGDTFTPVAGTPLTGYGESKLFQNLFDLGGKLILHPIRLADNDRSEDVIFWRSAPLPETLNYDGLSQQGLAVSFVAYLDRSKPKEINIFARGDWSQDGIIEA